MGGAALLSYEIGLVDAVGRIRGGRLLAAVLAALLVLPMGLTLARSRASAATPPTLDLRVLLIGGAGGASDPTTAAWASALADQGVAYTQVDATGAVGSETVTLPTLSSGTTGDYNGVVISDSPADFAAGALSSVFSYEASFGVNQVDGYTAPFYGETLVAGGALDGTTGRLTPAGLAGLPALAGPVPFDTGTVGYAATATAGAPFTPWLSCQATPAVATCPSGDVLAGVYQHPSSDPQANVSELELNFDYNATQLQWLLMAPGLINWVTHDTHLGLQRNYVEMDIDDTFTPDNAWSTTLHDNDYSDANSQRMSTVGNDVAISADWSNPTQENDPSARPAGAPSTPFRLDQLFNYGGTVEYQNGELDLPGSPGSAGQPATGPDPVLAEFQATDPATGKPYSADFGWLSHTYDTPYLDVGCATQDYIEAELNQNTNDVLAAPDAALPGAVESGLAGTGGLGLTSSSIPAGSTDVSNAYGTYNPQVFVPGNHSGFADLVPGTPATVDPPDLDNATPSSTGGTLATGSYEYAVTDQFNGSDSTSVDQSQAYVTDGQQGDIAPVVVAGSTGSVSLVWQSICHAANYIIYRSAAPYTSWTEIGTYATPDSATLPDKSSGDTSPAQGNTVCSGPAGSPTSCAGEQGLTFDDTGATSGTTSAGVTYMDTPMPAGWTPPVVENANELPWEQNPNFNSALSTVGITTVGADASKAYPNPPDDQFGIGATYSGPTYAAGQPFVDGTAQVAPRHPINIFYNAATNAQELDEYNTLYTSVAPDSQCHNTATTTCASTLYTFPQVINQVVSGMMQNLLSNNPEVSYVHQTNIMGAPPYSSILPPANYVPVATAQPGTDGDGTLYEVLNPLISDYDSYFNANTPYVQLTLGGIGNTLADQTAWSGALAESTPSVSASQTSGVVTITNSGSPINVPITLPAGTTVNGSAFGQSYGGQLSDWVNVGTGATETFDLNVPLAFTSPTSATSIVGTPLSLTLSTTGEPVPAITENGSLPAGLTFTDNGDGTATIAGTPAAASGGSYPVTLTATNASGTISQAFTLTNAEAPTITSPPTAAFVTGIAGTYNVTTTGYPAATISESGALPAGLSFTTNGNGTATIAGTATTAGTYPVSLSATNVSGSTSTLALTITVGTAAAPTISSLATANFTVGQVGSFAVTTTGAPAPALTESGALPAGLTWADGGDGIALLQGTPTTAGTTNVTVTAANGQVPNATQTLSIVVGQAPAVTSAAAADFAVGSPGTFKVSTTGYPAPALAESGALPSGVTFKDNGDGTATLAGTPATGTTGSYQLTLTATNGTSSITQSFTLVVNQAPAFTSTASTDFPVGSAGSFSVTTSGVPVASITETGALPSGVTFKDNGDGTATLAGTPAAGAGGTYPLTLTATNSAGSITQSFTLSVDEGPAVTSASSTNFSVGTAGTFTVTATGSPPPSLTESGALPSGVTFRDNGNGTATLAGTPASGTDEIYPLTFTAANRTGSTPQSFSLRVDGVAGITSAPQAAFSVGTAGSFQVTTSGYPAPSLTESGAFPSGVTFKDNGNGTATLAGTPAAGTGGAYPLAITATNGTGHATQSFTLRVAQAPRITSAAQTNLSVGTAGTFKVTTTGYPAPALTEKGALPTGAAFKDNGNGTATLAGTPAAGTAGTYQLTLTAKNASGSISQSHTLIVGIAVSILRPGGGTDIGVGANGSVWIIGGNRVSGGYGIYRWNGRTWTAMPGGAVRIAVDRAGNAWVVNSAHHIYHWTGRTWASYPGTATDIGVGANGSVWIIGAHPVSGGYGIYRWNGRAWAAVPGAAVRIAVDQGGNAWVVNSAHHIYHWTGKGWAAYPGTALDIGVGANGSVWIVGTNPVAGGYGIYHWNGKTWTAVPGGAVGISVDPKGNPWVVNSAHHIYSS